MVEKRQEAAQVAVDVASAVWRRFLCGPVGSIGIVRWVAAWVAHTFLVLLAVATTLRDRPHQVTLWWLLLLAWLVGNVASVAREQKRHDPRAWVLVTMVFLISGMTVPLAWYSVGLTLLVAAAIHSRPVEWAGVFVQRVGGWATMALVWVGAWALLTNLSLAALEPLARRLNPHAITALEAILSAVSTVFSASGALLALRLLLRGYRRLREQQEV
jgi:hypothetical protein